jgi:hypothetical protein
MFNETEYDNSICKCGNIIDNNLILTQKSLFENINKKNIKKYNYSNKLIIVPVSINICLRYEKYNIDFIKYCKYMINILNDGFSGQIHCQYKYSINTLYSQQYIFDILNNINNSNKINKELNSELIYKYVNNSFDTKIRFYLDTIEYFDKNFVTKNKNIDKIINEFDKKGFKIRKNANLNINIINFESDTLGVSVFPWMKYFNYKHSIMQVFIDYKTIHKDISNLKYNMCKTLIHEVGHIFGLKHTFTSDEKTLNSYKILFGKFIFETEFINNIKIHNINQNDILDIKNDISQTKNLYYDIPFQIKPTIHDPFIKNIFPFVNDIPVNFACFMDYSPDVVLTHFTNSQIKIMHYMILLFKNYLTENTYNYVNKLNNNNKIKLYLPEKTLYINNKYIKIDNKLNIKHYINYNSDNNLIFTVTQK